ncbi:MAG: hypothetical protein WCS27_16400, partial [Victivallaceae bacterium]
MNGIFKKVFIAAALFFTLNCAFADFWESVTPYGGPRNDVITLIVTANYKHPLIIAQLIQNETKQPYLLLPSANTTGIFFNPPPKRSMAALEIRESNLSRFIRFLNPKQIVILGDERYVPEKYRKMIDKNIPVICVSGNDWQRIADSLSILLYAHNLGDDYKDICGQLKRGLYKPTKPDSKTTPETLVAEELVVEEKQPAPKKEDAKADV